MEGNYIDSGELKDQIGWNTSKYIGMFNDNADFINLFEVIQKIDSFGIGLGRDPLKYKLSFNLLLVGANQIYNSFNVQNLFIQRYKGQTFDLLRQVKYQNTRNISLVPKIKRIDQ